MAWQITCVGKLKKGSEYDLCQEYIKRCSTKISIVEVEEKRPLSEDELKQKEARLMLDTIPSGAIIVALDERGKTMSSPDFAEKIQGFEMDGKSNIVFIIGGAFGLHPTIRQKSDMTISFGQMTFPHMMVRAMLCEQLYRARAILSGHPYHKV